jgi:hypothetical protein
MHVVTMGAAIATTEFYGPLNQLLTRIASEPEFHGLVGAGAFRMDSGRSILRFHQVKPRQRHGL